MHACKEGHSSRDLLQAAREEAVAVDVFLDGLEKPFVSPGCLS
jgi:hypothetical protein